MQKRRFSFLSYGAFFVALCLIFWYTSPVGGVTSWLQITNGGVSSLASGISDSATSFSVASGEGALFPSSNFHVVIGDGAGAEIVLVGTRTTDAFSSVTRAQEGTSAVAHVAGEMVALNVTKAYVTEMQTAINGIESGTTTLAEVKTNAINPPGDLVVTPVGGDTAIVGEFGINTTDPIDSMTIRATADNAGATGGWEAYSTSVGTTGVLFFRKSASNTRGTKTQSVDTDVLGYVSFQGVDTGSNFELGPQIRAVQNGAAGASRIPGDLFLEATSNSATHTGQFKVATDGFVYVNNGLIANEAGDDYDSRIEGASDANLIYIDAGNDRVGIGDSTPEAKLDVTGSGRFTTGLWLHAFASPAFATNEMLQIASAAATGLGTGFRVDQSADRAVRIFGNASSAYNLRLENDGASTYNFWVEGDVSALTFTDRSPLFEGDALAVLRGIKAEQGTRQGDWSEVDHSTLPEGVRADVAGRGWKDPQTEQVLSSDEAFELVSERLIGSRRTPVSAEEHEAQVYAELSKEFESVETVEEGRDIGAMIQVNARAIVQLLEKVEALEAEVAALQSRVR